MFNKNFHHEFLIWFKSGLFAIRIVCFIYISRRKVIIPTEKMHYHPEKKFYHHQTNFRSIGCENFQDFNVYICICCWDDDCKFFKWHATSYESLVKLFSVILICFIWTASGENVSIITLANPLVDITTLRKFPAVYCVRRLIKGLVSPKIPYLSTINRR